MFNVLDRVLDTMLFVILAAMVAVSGTNVFLRFVLDFSVAWADEVALALLVWLTFLGAAVAMREHSHYMFDYTRRSLEGDARFYLVLVGRLVTGVALACLLFWSAQVTWGVRDWVLPATQMSRALVYVACPLGCVFMLVYIGRDLVIQVRERRAGEAGTTIGEATVLDS